MEAVHDIASYESIYLIHAPSIFVTISTETRNSRERQLWSPGDVELINKNVAWGVKIISSVREQVE